MPSRKASVAKKSAVPIPSVDAPVGSWKISQSLQLPLLITLTLTLSTLLRSFSNKFTAAALDGTSRSSDSKWEVGALLVWKALELSLGWYGGYNGCDIMTLSLLSHGPPLYLLRAFYNTEATTVLSSLLIDTVSIYLPFRLLRSLSAAPSSQPVPKHDMVTDPTVKSLTTILAASIYSLVLYGAYVTYLPVALVTYFDSIPSVEAAHNSSFITLFPWMLLLGLAARSFIFTPISASQIAKEDAKIKAFDPVTATFGQTLRWNVWGWSARTKTIVKRTAVLIIISGINTFAQIFTTINGVEVQGAAAYSAVWVFATTIIGVALAIVGAV